jgi:putative ABC transport system ATP-binding protein
LWPPAGRHKAGPYVKGSDGARVTAPAPLYRLRQLRKSYEASGSRFELLVEELDIAPGTVLAVTGPSGSGKSTLLDMLALALRPDDATTFTFGPPPSGHDVMKLWREGRHDALARLRASHCGYVLQTGGLLPFLTVFGNIALTQRIAGRVDRAYVETLASRLGIAAQLGKRPAQLSVGQRQRVAIARALAHRPQIVLADEPTASVHPALGAEIAALLVAETRAAGAALVVATHDPELLASFAPRTLAPAAEGTTARSVFALAA